jgi:hypothetical protein
MSIESYALTKSTNKTINRLKNEAKTPSSNKKVNLSIIERISRFLF